MTNISPIVHFRKYLNTQYPFLSKIQKNIYAKWLIRLFRSFQNIPEFSALSSVVKEDFFNHKKTSFFYPHLYLMKTPFLLPDMYIAIEILKKYAQSSDKKLVIYADRDADGITSASILYLFLTQTMQTSSETIQILLPQKNDQYGITDKVATRIISFSPDILVVLDCGSANKDSFIFLSKKLPNLQTIIIDHHFLPQKTEDFPNVNAFINPKRLPITSTEQDLCTAGLTYKLIWGITYSFTSEFQKAYQYDDTHSYCQDGLIVPKAPAPIPENLFIDQIKTKKLIKQEWTRLKEKFPIFQKIEDSFNNYLTIPHQIWILQTSLLQKVQEKVKPYLPLAMVGTIADMVPTIDDNRLIIIHGLKVLKETPLKSTAGLYNLISASNNLHPYISEQDIAFYVSPAINAAGRLGQPHVALKTLISIDQIEALKNSKELLTLNEKRKKLSKEGTDTLQKQYNHDIQKNHKILLFYHPNIHKGISGLLANQLNKYYQKPVIVIVDEDQKNLRGSIRAYQEENVLEVLHQHQSLFKQYGGHRFAAGFTITRDKLPILQDKISQLKDGTWKTQRHSFSLSSIKVPLKDTEVSEQLWLDIQRFSPYGMLNPHPQFKIPITGKYSISYLGDKRQHLKIQFHNTLSNHIEGIWFFATKHISEEPNKYIIIAEPHINYFRGKQILQLKIQDMYTQYEPKK